MSKQTEFLKKEKILHLATIDEILAVASGDVTGRIRR